jgi:signal transduction histidine kinase
MNRAVASMPARIIGVEVLAWFFLISAFVLIGPTLLLLDPELSAAASIAAAVALPAAATVAIVLTHLRMRRERSLLRALTLGSGGVEPEQIASLCGLPAYVTTVFVTTATGAVVLAMLTPMRPALFDFDTALSLSLLAIIMVVTAALPLHVTVRAAVARAFEITNPDIMGSVLDALQPRDLLRRRLIWRLAVAIATPVAFAAFGSALVANAHIRKFDADSRERTAETIAHIVLQPSADEVAVAAREEAIAAATDLGFRVSVDNSNAPRSVFRGKDGRIVMTVPGQGELATVRFRVSAMNPFTPADAGIVLFALLIASAFGLLFGTWLADDLAAAASRVRLLGTEEVVRGSEWTHGAARFRQVEALNFAVDTLAGRFRIFASAQERAIEAREAAQRLRSLLFTSVSHDLRAPLNSILGFTELIRQKQLLRAQQQSLRFIDRSGRELLTLIETILDTSKIDAGQLTLVRSAVNLGGVVADAMRTTRLLAAGRPVDFALELEDDLPPVWVDQMRLRQAIAAIVWYSARASDPGAASEAPVRAVEVRARKAADSSCVELEIEDPNSTIGPEEMYRILYPEPGTTGRRGYSSLTLGLTLARSLIELHDGTIEVRRRRSGTALLHIRLPTAP